MRLLYLTNGHPPLHTAGTETYTAGLARAFAAEGHAVRVVCAGEWQAGPRPLNGSATTDHDGVAVTRLDLNWTRGPDPNGALFDNPETARALDDILAAERPDLVHATSCYTLSASVIRAVKARGLPLAVTLTDFWFLCPQVSLRRSDGALCDGQTTAWDCLRCMLGPSRAYRWPARVLPEPLLRPALTWVSRQPALTRRRGLRGLALDIQRRKHTLPALLEQADLIIAPSRFLAGVYARNGLRRPIRVVPYGHDLGWVKAVRPRPPGGRVVFGYLGRLTDVKGCHVLLEAARRLPPGAGCEVRLWGSPDQEPAYTARLRALADGAGNIHFMGRFGRHQAAEVFNQIDVLVVPSLWYENNPLVVQEAFAAGRPVIASRLGGLAEFVHNEADGLLFEAGDSAGLADAMQRMLAPALRQQLAAARPAVRTMAEETETLGALYMELVAGRCLEPESSPSS